MEPIRILKPEDFPPLLLEISDAPKKLFIQGEFPKDPNLIFLSVVGSRNHTDYGAETCRTLITGLAGLPVVIVSGLALGIDTIAHTTALEVGLTTIAVPGSGLSQSVLYPKSNLDLAQKILQSGGCLLTEYEPTFRATKWSFPRRNRIMAGLCHAVLIIEAERKSGSLITAKLATEYNRDVLAVPGSIFSLKSEGPNFFIGLGATPITSTEELKTALGFSDDSTKSTSV